MWMNNCIDEDIDLWKRFLEGDKIAFSIFYKKNYSILYSYGVGLKIGEDRIRDLIQDIFLKIYTSPSVITDFKTIRSFMLVSFRNAFINQEKKEKRFFDIDTVDFDFHYSVENSFWDENEKQMMQLKVEKILNKLTPRQKEIIYFRFLYQMGYEDIAKIMNMSEQAARNLVHRAITRIREDNPQNYILLLIFLSKIHF